jgi:hypothetical protein
MSRRRQIEEIYLLFCFCFCFCFFPSIKQARAAAYSHFDHEQMLYAVLEWVAFLSSRGQYLRQSPTNVLVLMILTGGYGG